MGRSFWVSGCCAHVVCTSVCSGSSCNNYWVPVPYQAQGCNSKPDGQELVPQQRTQMREGQMKRVVGRQVALQSGGVSKEASVTAVV